MKNSTSEIPNWYAPNPNSVWFDYVADAIVSDGNAEITLIEFTLPVASKGVIKWFGQEVCPSNQWELIKWKISINDAPDKIYGSIVGEISSIKDPTEVYLYLDKGANVKFIVTYDGNARNTKVVGRLKGWHWVEDYEI